MKHGTEGEQIRDIFTLANFFFKKMKTQSENENDQQQTLGAEVVSLTFTTPEQSHIWIYPSNFTSNNLNALGVYVICASPSSPLQYFSHLIYR